ncbi:ATP cone domain-containing protein [Candidatus Saccharibacteria bacterium]|nr:ATP cone domain-containing protein [Candidatus Saccharibacteria bacterium]
MDKPRGLARPKDLLQISNSRVLESRESNDGTTIRRRRETTDGRRFTTYERVERPNIVVVKRSGQREFFDHTKLQNAIHRSVGKFLNGELAVEDLVNRVESAVYTTNADEITSREIGEQVLAALAEINDVAYVRFASVFYEFKTLSEFERILATRIRARAGDKKEKK